MNSHKGFSTLAVFGVLVLVTALGYFFYIQNHGVTEKEMAELEKEVLMDKETSDDFLNQETAGSYEDYSFEKVARSDGNTVLFFYAPWCPYCRALDADINKNLNNIPSDVTILKTNYDSETALKQKYGVTYQHTFVQVDTAGNELAQWSGSLTLGALLKEIQ